MIVDDVPVVLADPAAAFARGIGMVHQEFMLVDSLTLLENLILGARAVRRGVIDRAAALAAARDARAHRPACSRLGSRTVAEAPVHLRQIVEILRLLYRGADVLILDEPTSVLAPQQVHDLLRRCCGICVDEGRTILLHQPQARRGAGGGRPHHRAARRTRRRHHHAGARPTRRSSRN